jgi:hypothetical protein
MESLLTGSLIIADGGSNAEEVSSHHPWPEDYLERIERKVASKESLDSREYYVLIGLLLA